MDERLHIEPDPTVQVGSMNPDDVVEPDYGVPSEGSRRCMIYRHAGHAVVESTRRIESTK